MNPTQLHKLFLHWLRELLKDEPMRRFLRAQLDQAELPVIPTGARRKR